MSSHVHEQYANRVKDDGGSERIICSRTDSKSDTHDCFGDWRREWAARNDTWGKLKHEYGFSMISTCSLWLTFLDRYPNGRWRLDGESISDQMANHSSRDGRTEDYILPYHYV